MKKFLSFVVIAVLATVLAGCSIIPLRIGGTIELDPASGLDVDGGIQWGSK